MADELRIKVVLDSGEVKDGFLAVERQADKSSKKIGQSFDKKGSGLQDLADGAEAASNGISGMAQAAVRAAGPYGTLAAAVAVAGSAAFRMALAGEQVNAINAQFANVATSAGLAADKFGESIINATQGLIDDEDALKIATQGIIALGEQASKIPQIMDAARGASGALGKDFKTTFEDLSTFVEFGNARVLRNYGIVLDLDKAYANAAKSIGLTASALTEQQKQQIRANLILDEVPKKFSSAAESVTPLKDAFDKLKVSSGNAFDSLAITFNKILGPAIQSATDLLDSFIKKQIEVSSYTSNDSLSANLARFNTTVLEAKIKIPILNAQIDELNKKLATSASVGEKVQINTQIQRLQSQVERLSSTSDIAKEKIKQLGGATINGPEAAAASGDAGSSGKNDKLKITKEQAALIKQEELKRLNDLQAYVSAQDKLVIDSEIKRIETLTSLDQKLTAQKSLFSQQSILLEQQKNTAIAQVEQQFSDTNKFTQEQRDVAILATKQNYYLQEQALAQANADKIKSIEDNKNISVTNGFFASVDGMKLAAQDFANNSIMKFQELGKQTFATIGTGVGKAFQNFGAALKSGKDAGKAFESAIGDTIAGVASQFGDLFIQTGVGKLALSYGADATGYALIAAGAALKLLVGASGAGGGAASSAGSDTGGGIAASPSTATDLTQPQDLQRAEATTGVSIVIQGDVLDSDESGSRIVSLINSAFDKKGVVINQGVMA